MQYATVLEPLPGEPGRQRDMVAWEVLFAKPPENARFFYGPKDFDVLASVDRTLVKAIHFGIWDFLAVPLLRALQWIYGYIGNYGWSIIILTVLINLVMFPLRHKSVVSMRRMQELQPADQSDPGSVRQDEGDRSRAPEDAGRRRWRCTRRRG